jgi:hypothetical protein
MGLEASGSQENKKTRAAADYAFADRITPDGKRRLHGAKMAALSFVVLSGFFPKASQDIIDETKEQVIAFVEKVRGDVPDCNEYHIPGGDAVLCRVPAAENHFVVKTTIAKPGATQHVKTCDIFGKDSHGSPVCKLPDDPQTIIIQVFNEEEAERLAASKNIELAESDYAAATDPTKDGSAEVLTHDQKVDTEPIGKIGKWDTNYEPVDGGIPPLPPKKP